MGNNDLIDVWLNRVNLIQTCHYKASYRCDKFNYLLGIPSIILSMIVGTVIITNSTGKVYSIITIAFGIGGILVSVLTSLQTFLQFNERAEKHRIFAAKYASIGRDFEFLKSNQNYSDDEIKKIEIEINALAIDAPKIPHDILHKVSNSNKKDRIPYPLN